MSNGHSYRQYMFHSASRIIAGQNSIYELVHQLKGLGEVRSALIITGSHIRGLGFIDEINSLCSQAGISTQVLVGVMPEPTADNIETLFQTIQHEKFDVLIGVGGGSVLDATKMLSVMATNGADIKAFIGTDRVPRRGISTVLIPTTSGTGSEVTPNAIVTLPEEQLKLGIVSPYLLPQLAILDPVLTLNLPKPITAATGMDAFTHAFESFISNKANLFSNMLALESIRLISQSMLTAYHEGSCLEAREHMLVGSMFGGMALTCAGTAAVHALAYPLGGKFNIPHGVANSMLLPHVTQFNLDAISDRLGEVAKAMNLTGASASHPGSAANAELVISRIMQWTKELEIPQDLTAYGVQESDVASLAESASKVTRLLNNNPKAMEVKDMENVYRKLLPQKHG